MTANSSRLARAPGTAPITRHTHARQLLMRILEQPGLVTAIQSLEPEVLAKLIERVGLEDAGELIAFARPQQLLAVFDADLWRSPGAGEDETFDAGRFALWLEVLIDCGPKVAAQKVAEMDEDFLVLALCRQVLVLDVEELARRLAVGDCEDDVDLLLKELEGGLYQEFEQYRVFSKNSRSWEAIRMLLVELDAEHSDLFLRLLERCCAISSDYVEDNGGLYEVLSSDEMMEADVAGARTERRAAKGYVSPSTAKSFLSHARLESLESLRASDAHDANTRAYFRELGAARPQVSGPRSADARALTSSRPARGVRDDRAAELGAAGDLLEILRAADVIPASGAAALLATGEPGASLSELPIARAMRALRARDESRYAALLDEIAYLANVLLAGCRHRGREFRPTEAAEAALATCNLGAEQLISKQRGINAEDAALVELLCAQGLVKPFRIGWHILAGELGSGFEGELIATGEQLRAARALRNASARRRSTKSADD